MRKHIFLFLLLLSICCKAQIKSLYDDEYGVISGAYYKDIYNDFNRFEGSWILENANSTLISKLKKKEHLYINGLKETFYQDILVGEYRYIDNGIEKINTLPNLLVEYEDPYFYNLAGDIINKPVSGVPEACLNCGPNDVKVKLTFGEPNREIFWYEPSMLFHHFIENGVEKARVVFASGGNYAGSDSNSNGGFTNPYSTYTIPFGVYILTKQL